VLAASAEQVPLEQKARSLWPVLERRITLQNARKTWRWLRAARRLADRWMPLTAFDLKRPLRLAWTRDALIEAINHRRTSPLRKRNPSLLWKSCAAAAVVIVFTGIPLARQQWVDAQATMARNTVPPADDAAPALAVDEPAAASDLGEGGEAPAQQLAEADIAPPSEASGFGPDGGATPRQAAQSRYSYDVERGTRMTPDTREPKPVY
jgi:hypothetical protein